MLRFLIIVFKTITFYPECVKNALTDRLILIFRFDI